jgi:citrate synthase/citryl-CoA lyase
MQVLEQVVSGETPDRVIREITDRGERVPGFGHRQHKDRDPRVNRLFELAAKEDLGTPHIAAAIAVEAALLARSGNPVPLNIDGAMAAILGDIDVPAEFANAIFITARLGGVLRHAIEEQGMTPMRRIGPDDHTYTGPEPRQLPEEEGR